MNQLQDKIMGCIAASQVGSAMDAWGYAVSQRSAGYGFGDPATYSDFSNANTLIVVYCETANGIANLDHILAVDGVDVVFVGPWDLSQALGVIGQPNHPEVQATIDRIIQQTRAAGKAVGTIATDETHAKQLIDRGMQYLSISSDLGMIASVSRRLMAALK